jgi:hypothetical protein
VRPAILTPAANGAAHERHTRGEEESQKGNDEDHEEVDRRRRCWCRRFMCPSAEAQEWHRIIRASVRDCLETWTLQAQGGPVSVEALETILARRHGSDLAPGRGTTA